MNRSTPRSMTRSDAHEVCGVMMTFGVRYSGESGAERLLAEDVEHRAADPARLQRAAQRQLVDEAAAGDVDEPRVLAHLRQLLRTDEPGGLVGQRRGDDDDVAGAQHVAQLVEPEQLDAGSLARTALGMSACREDAAAERREEARDLLADAAIADDADGQLAQLAAAERLPRPLALELEELRQPSRDGQRHHHDVLGDRAAEDAAGVRDHQAALAHRRASRCGRPRRTPSGSSAAAASA